MNMTRKEIMPGVWLSHLREDKFKTACLSLSLLTQLERETAAMNALIPYVLRRGCTRYRDMEAISARLEELYGCAIEPVVRRIGEIQCLGFYASVPEGAFLPQGKGVLEDAAMLMGELLLSPLKRGGLLYKPYVDSEKEKMLERLRARINEKRSYSVRRCIEEMCCCEDFAVGALGGEDECESINYQKLTKRYRELLQSSPVEIFYCGRDGFDKVSAAMKDALMTLPRGEIDYDIGTDVRMNSLEENPRFYEEKLDVTQGKLVLGFRLGQCMEQPDIPALHVFNAIYGGGSFSKLFLNVRERLSLCYYAFSALELHKGIMLVSCGVDFDKFEPAKEEIFAQLEAMRSGDISEEELWAAKACVASDLRSFDDSQAELEGFYLSNALMGAQYSPLELSELVGEVTAESVKEIARSLECDMIYFLSGDEESEEDTDADD